MEQQPIMGKIEQLTNYSGGHPHSQSFSHEPYRITHNFNWDEFNRAMVESGKTKTSIEIEIDAADSSYDSIREVVKKICEDHDGKHELHIKIAGVNRINL